MDNKLSIILWYEGLGLAVCARRGYKFFRLSYGTGRQNKLSALR
jgi:hypothetical protein